MTWTFASSKNVLIKAHKVAVSPLITAATPRKTQWLSKCVTNEGLIQDLVIWLAFPVTMLLWCNQRWYAWGRCAFCAFWHVYSLAMAVWWGQVIYCRLLEYVPFSKPSRKNWLRFDTLPFYLSDTSNLILTFPSGLKRLTGARSVWDVFSGIAGSAWIRSLAAQVTNTRPMCGSWGQLGFAVQKTFSLFAW